jgi:HD-GYP domain-containing protein (c-di-GMP phosphodiesterase class II)
MIKNAQVLLKQIERINSIGMALSAESDHEKLLETILLGAQEITNADGGTIYTMSEDHKQLSFKIMRNKSLNIAYGGTTGKEIPFPPLNIFLKDEIPNLESVATYCAIKDKTVNLQNAYDSKDFDFAGMRKFDEETGYHSQSFIAVPMKNYNSEVIAVLQLINATDHITKEIIPFSPQHQSLVESLASQASIAMTNKQLVDGLKHLFEAFIELIANAVDKKSPYTGQHCRMVPELTMMLAEAAINTNHGPLKDFHLNTRELYELRVASWLHDCGKITTPESVMDKPRKLSTIFDRIQLIEERFETLKKQAECEMLKQQISLLKSDPKADFSNLNSLQSSFEKQCDDDFNFLCSINIGSEFMSDADYQRLLNIASTPLKNKNNEPINFLNENEVYNLSIKKGTLTKEERDIINHHIVATIDMLDSLPYPKELMRVPEYACNHHERMDGKGYPRGLTKAQMSIPARIMGIADIFEALTSQDRPYKKAKTLSESLSILGKMKLDNHIDPDLFVIFISEKIYLKYAEKFLDKSQIDAVDESKIPGYLAS